MVIPLRDDNPTRNRAWVTIAIIAACIYIYGFVQPHSTESSNVFLAEHAAIPCEVVHLQPISNDLSERCDGQLGFSNLPGSVEPFPRKSVLLAIIVSIFLHGSWEHVLGNMLFLWIFGNNVEDRLGPVGYSVFFLVAGVVAAFAHIATQANSTVPVVGASGAIAGIMGFYLVNWPKARVLTFTFFFLVSLPAWVVLIGWFGLQFFTNPNTGVAVGAHIGGFIFGALVGLAAKRAAPPPAADPGFRGSGY